MYTFVFFLKNYKKNIFLILFTVVKFFQNIIQNTFFKFLIYQLIRQVFKILINATINYYYNSNTVPGFQIVVQYSKS